MKQDKMYICPKAKDGSCKYKADCPDSIEHEYDSSCGATGYFFRQGVRYDCPACIPYREPQPATCPDCGHKAHEGYICLTKNINGCYCECNKVSADLQPKHCTKCGKGRIVLHGLCEECLLGIEQPTPTMPLIESPEDHYPEDVFPMQSYELAKAIPDEHLLTAVSGCVGRYVWNVCCEDWQNLIAEWLPAHDSAIASKARREFAEKVSEKIENLKIPQECVADSCSYEAYNDGMEAALRVIRAMAGGRKDDA